MEIIIKFFDINFDENMEENKEDKSIQNHKIEESLKNFIPKQIWEKIFMLTEHPNFKLNLFSTYIINYLKPESLTEKMQERANYIKQKKDELTEIKNYFHDKFGILSIKKTPEKTNLSNLNNLTNNNNYDTQLNSNNLINNNNNNMNQISNLLSDSINFTSANLDFINNNNNNNSSLINNANFNGLQQQYLTNQQQTDDNFTSQKSIWFSEGELKSLKNYIKEKIICIGKLRNDISNVFKSINIYEDKEDLEFCNKKHAEGELSDDFDFEEVIQENENSEDDEDDWDQEYTSSKNKNVENKINKNLQSKLINANKINKHSEKVNNSTEKEAGIYYDKERDEYLDLAELGVLEVDDDIFENFDEENIPVIKNIYKRKKGSAEKFKTNQSNRNMFLNNQNNTNAQSNLNTNAKDHNLSNQASAHSSVNLNSSNDNQYKSNPYNSVGSNNNVNHSVVDSQSKNFF